MLARIIFCMTMGVAFISTWAQDTKDPGDPLQEYLLPPEFIIEHQKAIDLSDGQKESIREVVKTAQSTFYDLQWYLKEQMDQFTSLLAAESVDEVKALQQLDKVLGIETKIKKAQMTLMIRVKNTLTPAQQKKLKEIRAGS
ncbi:MAG: hypothetical protein HKN76_17860 [Saprospiraceae bacterium]|nr:hypothetical protein [Saprospiraceae bacterium]